MFKQVERMRHSSPQRNDDGELSSHHITRVCRTSSNGVDVERLTKKYFPVGLASLLPLITPVDDVYYLTLDNQSDAPGNVLNSFRVRTDGEPDTTEFTKVRPHRVYALGVRVGNQIGFTPYTTLEPVLNDPDTHLLADWISYMNEYINALCYIQGGVINQDLPGYPSHAIQESVCNAVADYEGFPHECVIRGLPVTYNINTGEHSLRDLVYIRDAMGNIIIHGARYVVNELDKIKDVDYLKINWTVTSVYIKPPILANHWDVQATLSEWWTSDTVREHFPEDTVIPLGKWGDILFTREDDKYTLPDSVYGNLECYQYIVALFSAYLAPGSPATIQLFKSWLILNLPLSANTHVRRMILDADTLDVNTGEMCTGLTYQYRHGKIDLSAVGVRLVYTDGFDYTIPSMDTIYTSTPAGVCGDATTSINY